MIQDIAPHVYHNEYRLREPKPDDVVLSYSGREIYLHKDGTFFHISEMQKQHIYDFLFMIDETAFFLTDLENENAVLFSLNTLRTYPEKEMAFAGITGWQLYDWMRTNRYCGACGAEMQKDVKERAMRCPHCDHIIYPIISPAVIVGVKNEKDQILLTRYSESHGGYRNYALVAGFAEIGEPIEDTVRREVLEETGLHVKNIRYYKSQPWSFSGTLLMGFWCEADSHEPIRIEREELSVAEWHDRNSTIEIQSDFSLTGEMMHLYFNEKEA